MKDFGLKKLYYSISEVSKLAELEQYILRYWETEFEQLKPSKNRAGNRIYTNSDIKLILQIKKLLRDEKYTIEGAKRILSDPNNSTLTHSKKYIPKAKSSVNKNTNVRSLKRDLEEMRKFLVDLRSKI